jgi:hypothetical protein
MATTRRLLPHRVEPLPELSSGKTGENLWAILQIKRARFGLAPQQSKEMPCTRQQAVNRLLSGSCGQGQSIVTPVTAYRHKKSTRNA